MPSSLKCQPLFHSGRATFVVLFPCVGLPEIFVELRTFVIIVLAEVCAVTACLAVYK